jgi:hypothetical protein
MKLMKHQKSDESEKKRRLNRRRKRKELESDKSKLYYLNSILSKVD